MLVWRRTNITILILRLHRRRSSRRRPLIALRGLIVAVRRLTAPVAVIVLVAVDVLAVVCVVAGAVVAILVRVIVIVGCAGGGLERMETIA